ncbi:hypothetical protein HNR00_004165 [Methylorubrum rhodinum]|uniref:Uncharacterized protein n=1 Tax=Methylorubrum rhodinum TaxID=29428 RepID=A0A840ZRD4_9HYPH|nr:hypothetical protein [Methylorubrum rhodinum]MBB5759431.1 hypothetical protein [Methylorubrum rhodinum]
MSLIDNEQTKLWFVLPHRLFPKAGTAFRADALATALNTAATSCFTVGIATPIAGYLYNVGGLRTALPLWVLAGGLVAWFAAAVVPHLSARRVLRRLRV